MHFMTSGSYTTQPSEVPIEQPSEYKLSEAKPSSDCANIPNWDAGYGKCHTYTPGKSNHNYCQMDHSQDKYAQEVCAECGHCGEDYSMDYSMGDGMSMDYSMGDSMGDVDCDICVAEFKQNGGCECWKDENCNQEDLAPAGCDPCGQEAAFACGIDEGSHSMYPDTTSENPTDNFLST
jgi:hypothetical protein